MSPSEFILLFVLVAGIYYWLNTIFAKEIAVKHGKNRCKELGVTFLDETVEITKVRLKRNPRGTVVFWREYSFEFSSDGVRRFSGQIVLHGKVLVDLKMSAYPESASGSTDESADQSQSTYDSTVVDINDAKSESGRKNNFPTGFR